MPVLAERRPRIGPRCWCVCTRTGPVSYTHLDVYKRQQPDSPLQTLPVGRGGLEQGYRETGFARFPVSISATHFLRDDRHDFVMTTATAGGAGSQSLDFLKFLFHIGKATVLIKCPLDVSHGHVLAIADDLIQRCLLYTSRGPRNVLWVVVVTTSA